MLTGALTTQLPEDQGNVCDWELSHSTQKTMMPKEAGFGIDTLCIILSSQRAPRLESKMRHGDTNCVLESGEAIS